MSASSSFGPDPVLKGLLAAKGKRMGPHTLVGQWTAREHGPVRTRALEPNLQTQYTWLTRVWVSGRRRHESDDSYSGRPGKPLFLSKAKNLIQIAQGCFIRIIMPLIR